MDIVDALLKHHKEIRELMEKAAHDKRKFATLKKHLEVHHRNEELYFLNEIKNKSGIGDEAAEAAEEHYYIDFMLRDLERFPHDNKRWGVKFGILQEFTEHHLKEEEEDIFREIHKVMEKRELEEMGKEFETVKKRQLEAL